MKIHTSFFIPQDEMEKPVLASKNDRNSDTSFESSDFDRRVSMRDSNWKRVIFLPMVAGLIF